jgi:hypothetical protein
MFYVAETATGSRPHWPQFSAINANDINLILDMIKTVPHPLFKTLKQSKPKQNKVITSKFLNASAASTSSAVRKVLLP